MQEHSQFVLQTLSSHEAPEYLYAASSSLTSTGASLLLKSYYFDGSDEHAYAAPHSGGGANQSCSCWNSNNGKGHGNNSFSVNYVCSRCLLQFVPSYNRRNVSDNMQQGDIKQQEIGLRFH